MTKAGAEMELNRFLTSRRTAILITALFLNPLSACGAHQMTVTLDIVYFSYLDRPIFDASIDGKAKKRSDPYPATGGATISGVTLSLGSKKVSWKLGGPEGMSRNGEEVIAKNSPQLINVPKDAQYLAIHIYPDDTVELVPSKYFPEATEKGIQASTSRGR